MYLLAHVLYFYYRGLWSKGTEAVITDGIDMEQSATIDDEVHDGH